MLKVLATSSLSLSLTTPEALRGKECSPRTNSRLAYLKALQQLEIDYVEQITKMGVLPKNVASQTTTEYIFEAHVGWGGAVQTTPVNSKQLHDMERAERRMQNGHGQLARR